MRAVLRLREATKISPQACGYLALLYALVASGPEIRLVWLLSGQWDGDWWGLSDVMLWLGLVVGAAGQIFNRWWGHRMIVVASLGLALTATWNALDFWKAGLALPSLMNLFSALILVTTASCVYRLPRQSVLLFTSITVRAEQPTDSLQRETGVIVTATEPRGASSIRRRDRAYLAFTRCATVIFLLGTGEWSWIRASVRFCSCFFGFRWHS
jgi:hypothetical protein